MLLNLLFKSWLSVVLRRGTVKQSQDYTFGILENYHSCRINDFTTLVMQGFEIVG